MQASLLNEVNGLKIFCGRAYNGKKIQTTGALDYLFQKKKTAWLRARARRPFLERLEFIVFHKNKFFNLKKKEMFDVYLRWLVQRKKYWKIHLGLVSKQTFINKNIIGMKQYIKWRTKKSIMCRAQVRKFFFYFFKRKQLYLRQWVENIRIHGRLQKVEKKNLKFFFLFSYLNIVRQLNYLWSFVFKGLGMCYMFNMENNNNNKQYELYFYKKINKYSVKISIWFKLIYLLLLSIKKNFIIKNNFDNFKHKVFLKKVLKKRFSTFKRGYCLSVIKKIKKKQISVRIFSGLENLEQRFDKDIWRYSAKYKKILQNVSLLRKFKWEGYFYRENKFKYWYSPFKNQQKIVNDFKPKHLVSPIGCMAFANEKKFDKNIVSGIKYFYMITIFRMLCYMEIVFKLILIWNKKKKKKKCDET